MSGWTIAEPGDRVVAVVAHPDDESFGCGSLLALASAAGARVTVICMTRGEAGERRPDPTTDAWPLGLLRESELCQAAVVLGIEEVIIGHHCDSGFSGPQPEAALVQMPTRLLAEEVRARLVELDADVVVTLDGSDGHRDHVHLREAVDQAVAGLDRPVRLVHSCLARSLLQAWAEETARIDPSREYLAVDDIGRPDDELTEVDTSAVLEVRERAIACHLSQSSPFDGLSPELRHRMLTTDHIVEKVPSLLA